MNALAAQAMRATPPRSADNTVHDLIAISNDLRRHINDDLRRRGYGDLRPSFAPLLSRIREDGIPQGRLADELGISVQAASQTVGLAEQAGYVTRVANPNDGRSKLVVLTDAGRRFVEHGAIAIDERSAQYAEHVGEGRLARFDAALVRLQAGLGLDAEARLVTAIEPRRAIFAVVLLAQRATDQLRAVLLDGGHDEIRGTQNTVLVHIGQHGARASELARARRVSRQAISSTLHEIEALGYLSRRHDDNDARGVVFVPTKRGRRLLAEYIAGIELTEGEYRVVLGPSRFAQFAKTAHDLRHRIRLESTRESAPPRPPVDEHGIVARPDHELLGLAVDLHRWLGATDSARLAEFLGSATMQSAGGAPAVPPDSPAPQGVVARKREP